MPTRTWSDPNAKYKYGFNTQEKDDEIAGEGNINTALFWEYDTRLGRRWNIDPIIKFYFSPYACISDNPIIFIDVFGDDDFFDSKGKYIGSTATGTAIRIINKGITYDQATKDVNINTKLLANFEYSNTKIGLEHRKMLRKVLGYYGEPLGIDKNKIGSGFSQGGIAYYSPFDGFINIAIGADNKISAFFNDFNALKSSLIHEIVHRDDKSTGSPLYHYKAIIKEIESEFFAKAAATVEGFKSSPSMYASVLFQEAANMKVKGKYVYKTEDIQAEINIYNKAAQKAGLNTLGYNLETRQVTVMLPTVKVKGNKSKNTTTDSTKSR
jgi:hypothetical protein